VLAGDRRGRAGEDEAGRLVDGVVEPPPGLRRTMTTQNSISLSAPSPSKSPSASIPRRSSLDMPPRPSSDALRRRLSKVMSPLAGSVTRRNPLASSCISPSSPSCWPLLRHGGPPPPGRRRRGQLHVHPDRPDLRRPHALASPPPPLPSRSRYFRRCSLHLARRRR
jgi:arginine/serine-rich splicing factor 4/5/6